MAHNLTLPSDWKNELFQSKPFRFLDLAPEIRNEIYRFALPETRDGFTTIPITIAAHHIPRKGGYGMLFVSKQFKDEISKIIYGKVMLELSLAPTPPEDLLCRDLRPLLQRYPLIQSSVRRAHIEVADYAINLLGCCGSLKALCMLPNFEHLDVIVFFDAEFAPDKYGIRRLIKRMKYIIAANALDIRFKVQGRRKIITGPVGFLRPSEKQLQEERASWKDLWKTVCNEVNFVNADVSRQFHFTMTKLLTSIRSYASGFDAIKHIIHLF